MPTALNTLLVGDCRDLLPSVPRDSVHLVVADPPYNVGINYGEAYSDNLSVTDYLAFCEVWISQIRRVLTPTGAFWLFINDENVSELDVLAKRLGFFKRSHVIWAYSFGVNCENKFTRAHTHLLYYTKHRTEFTFNTAELKVKSSREMAGDKRAKPGGRLPDDVWVLRLVDLGPEAFPPAGDVWQISRLCGTFSERRAGAPTQLPEQLVGRIVRGCSNHGDLVCDPLCGTGTVLAVAKKLGRNYIGCELSPEFAAIATQRLSEVKPGDALAGPLPQGG
jgi:DNA modification methylase